MIEITTERADKNKDYKTIFKWLYQGEKIILNFSSMARYIYVEEKKEVFVTVYASRTVYRYKLNGDLHEEYIIPEMNGYQYRGINRNFKSKLGISLLFFPVDEKSGNEWRDIEQYELLSGSNPLGDFIDIYR